MFVSRRSCMKYGGKSFQNRRTGKSTTTSAQKSGHISNTASSSSESGLYAAGSSTSSTMASGLHREDAAYQHSYNPQSKQQHAWPQQPLSQQAMQPPSGGGYVWDGAAFQYYAPPPQPAQQAAKENSGHSGKTSSHKVVLEAKDALHRKQHEDAQHPHQVHLESLYGPSVHHHGRHRGHHHDAHPHQQPTAHAPSPQHQHHAPYPPQQQYAAYYASHAAMSSYNHQTYQHPHTPVSQRAHPQSHQVVGGTSANQRRYSDSKNAAEGTHPDPNHPLGNLLRPGPFDFSDLVHIAVLFVVFFMFQPDFIDKVLVEDMKFMVYQEAEDHEHEKNKKKRK